jgi:EAL domain-containing protein (putative c-di-GMP-specific phosphodiesterase class I)
MSHTGPARRAQPERLQQEHCDLGQGFLFARPLEAAAVEEFLTNHEMTGATALDAVAVVASA